jgi:hypothetical protein
VKIFLLILATLSLAGSAFITALGYVLAMPRWLPLAFVPALELLAAPAFVILAIRGRGLFMIFFIVFTSACLLLLCYHILESGSQLLLPTRQLTGSIQTNGLLLSPNTTMQFTGGEQLMLFFKSIAYLFLSLALIPRRRVEKFLRVALLVYSLIALTGLVCYRMGAETWGLSLSTLWASSAWFALVVLAMPAFMEEAGELLLRRREERRKALRQ